MEKSDAQRIHERIDDVLGAIAGVSSQMASVEASCRMCREELKKDIDKLDKWVDGNDGDGLRGRMSSVESKVERIEGITEAGKKLIWKWAEKAGPALIASLIGTGGGAGILYALLK